MYRSSVIALGVPDLARILNERLDRVRTERGCLCRGARFTALENGGSALVITADTSDPP